MFICSFRPSNSLAGEGILSLMGVARIDSIAKYGSIPVFRALSSVFFTVLIDRSSISFAIGYPADLVTCSIPHSCILIPESFMEDIDIYYDCDIDEPAVEDIFETMSANYSDALCFPYGRRELSFEEACAGLSGHLASIYTKSSSGFPLMQFTTSQGKKQYVSFDDDGNLQFDQGFKELVVLHCAEMEFGEKYVAHKWIGFLKDELVSNKKIDSCNTRVIFASNMITTVAFRMKYGVLLGAFNQTKVTPCAIGINKYSSDMFFYEHLTEIGGTQFVAGDYRGFDKRHQRGFSRQSIQTLI